MQKPIGKWIEQAKQQRKYIVFYEDKVIDITKFIFEHPGGKQVLINYIYKDITEVIFKIFSHQKHATLTKLNQHVIGYITAQKTGKTIKNSSISPFKKEKKKVSFQDEKTAQKNIIGDKSRIKASSKTNQTKESKNCKQNKQYDKDKRFKVSIKVMETSHFDKVIDEDKFKDWNNQPILSKKQSKPVSKKSKSVQKGNSFEDLEQKKPVFKVRNIEIKDMKSLSKE